MSYTPEQFMKDSGISDQEVKDAKDRMLEQMRLYELKEAREARNMTQKQLAESMGVSQKRISVLESGDVEHVEVSTLKRCHRKTSRRQTTRTRLTVFATLSCGSIPSSCASTNRNPAYVTTPLRHSSETPLFRHPARSNPPSSSCAQHDGKGEARHHE